jgi:CspA family cold shock protein
MNGTINRLTPERGFGFIRGEDGKHYFFHRNELLSGLRFDELREGQRVVFEPRQAERGPRAAEINPAAA